MGQFRPPLPHEFGPQRSAETRGWSARGCGRGRATRGDGRGGMHGRGGGDCACRLGHRKRRAERLRSRTIGDVARDRLRANRGGFRPRLPATQGRRPAPETCWPAGGRGGSDRRGNAVVCVWHRHGFGRGRPRRARESFDRTPLARHPPDRARSPPRRPGPLVAGLANAPRPSPRRRPERPRCPHRLSRASRLRLRHRRLLPHGHLCADVVTRGGGIFHFVRRDFARATRPRNARDSLQQHRGRFAHAAALAAGAACPAAARCGAPRRRNRWLV